jgi:hypothetical protein
MAVQDSTRRRRSIERLKNENLTNWRQEDYGEISNPLYFDVSSAEF